MNLSEKKKAVRSLARRVEHSTAIPSGIVDMVIFHMLHLKLPVKRAEQSFMRLKRAFVDWNEARISTVQEVRSALGFSKNADAVALAILTFLDRIHRDRHQTSLEFLNELTIVQVRKYLRSLKSLNGATIDLILRLKKSQAVVPLDKQSDRVLVRLGVVPSTYTLRQKQRFLQRLVPEEEVVSVHRAAVDLARRVCGEGEHAVKCDACPMRTGCGFYRRMKRRNGSHSRGGNGA